MDENNENKTVEVEEKLETLNSDEMQGKDSSEEKSDSWKYAQTTEKKTSNGLKFTIFLLIAIVVTAGALIAGVKGYDYINSLSKEKETVAEKEAEPSSEDVNTAVQPIVGELTDSDCQYVHYMTNTIIVAKDGMITGKEEITKESIEKALSLVQGKDEYLVKEIQRWQGGDFTNAVDVHNYVWDKLQGNIGKAADLNLPEIEKVKQRIEG